MLQPFGVPAGPAARVGTSISGSAVAPRLPGADARAARLRDRDHPWILPVSRLRLGVIGAGAWGRNHVRTAAGLAEAEDRKSTRELQSRLHLVCRLLLEKKKKRKRGVEYMR